LHVIKYFLLNNFNFRITKFENLPKLLHLFKFDELNTIIDTVTSNKYPLAQSIHPDYRGLNILNTDFDMNFIKQETKIKECK
jgi:hypothetical protein